MHREVFRHQIREEKKLYGKTLPLQLTQLLQPSFVNGFLTDASTPARKDTAANGSPRRLGPQSPSLPVRRAARPRGGVQERQDGLRVLQPARCSVQLTDVNALIPSYVPMADYHVVVALFCLPLARSQFFDALK